MTDPALSSDGLASLQARRTAAKKPPPPAQRRIPPSQNPTTLPPYRGPSSTESQAAPASLDQQPAPESASAPVREMPAPPEVPKAALRKVGVYLDESHEDFLEGVRVAGNALRPRVTLSGSAVLRLAMERLMADMSIEQVRDALLDRPADPTAVGRRRR